MLKQAHMYRNISESCVQIKYANSKQ